MNFKKKKNGKTSMYVRRELIPLWQNEGLLGSDCMLETR